MSRKRYTAEQTYYRWRMELGGMRVSQGRYLKEVQRENSRLKRVVAELAPDKLILREALDGRGSRAIMAQLV